MRVAGTAVVALAVGCIGANSEMLPTFPMACAAETCVPGTAVATSSDFAAAVNRAATSWPAAVRSSSGCMQASDDIIVEGEVSLGIDLIALPSGCGDECRRQAGFGISPSAQGVTCEDRGEIAWPEGCARVRASNATLRVRTTLEALPGLPFGTWGPVIRVVEACAADCPAQWVRCAATSTCWSTADEQCRFCLGGPPDVCACWNGSGFHPDGTPCRYFSSVDSAHTGACASGVCRFVGP